MKWVILFVTTTVFFLTVFSQVCLYADYVLEWKSPDNSEVIFGYLNEFFNETNLDLNGDSIPEIPIIIPKGFLPPTYQFYNSDYSETPLWSYTPSDEYPEEESDWTFLGFGDIDADGTKEAIFKYYYQAGVLSGNRSIVSIDITTGLSEWEFSLESSEDVYYDYMVYDIDKDGYDELLIQSDVIMNYHLEVWGSNIWTKVTNLTPESTPSSYLLSQNYPNPFNPSTKIEYAVQREGHVRIRIYNNLGQLVRTLVNEVKPAGEYSVIWNGKNDSERNVATGTYFYQLQVGEFVASKKLVLLR